MGEPTKVNKMILVIPPEIQIAGYIYRIVFAKEVLTKTGDRASCNLKEQKIRLHPEASPTANFCNLIHEIDHIAEDTCGADQQEANTIGRANLVAQGILSMGIEPDFSRIPTERIVVED